MNQIKVIIILNYVNMLCCKKFT